MKVGKAFRALYQKAVSRDGYWEADAILEFTIEMARLMDAQGVNNAELARRIGTSAAYITKILRGETNFTLRSMVKIARALGGRVSIQISPATAEALWNDVCAVESGQIAGEAVGYSTSPESAATYAQSHASVSTRSGASTLATVRPLREEAA